jgi:threonine dehydrogenase-like Zn-dependent dehydrogenase
LKALVKSVTTFERGLKHGVTKCAGWYPDCITRGRTEHEVMPASETAWYNNLTISGGPAPVRAYIEELLRDVLDGKIEPGQVFDQTVGLDGVPAGYRSMKA